MPSTINGRTVVSPVSGGTVSGFPDICKTPSPKGVDLIPYPNTAFSKDTAGGSITVQVDGCPVMTKGAVFSKSNGDEAGTAGGGIVSNMIKGVAEFKVYSFDVSVEGRNACRQGDLMGLNQMGPGAPSNTPPFPEVQPGLPVSPVTQQPKEATESDFEIVSLTVV